MHSAPCPYCGNSHTAGARYCPLVGKRLRRYLPTAWIVSGGLVGALMLAAGLATLQSSRGSATRAGAAAGYAASPDGPVTAGPQVDSAVIASPSLTHDSAPTALPPDVASTPIAGELPTVFPTTTPWSPCPGARPTRLQVGDHAYVSFEPPLANRVRESPGTQAAILGHVRPGEEVAVLKGPECASGWVWWRVTSVKTGLTGWTSEGDDSDYWLVPVP